MYLSKTDQLVIKQDNDM